MCRVHAYVAFALAGLAVACKTETTIDEVSCPQGSTLTYESFGRDFLAKNCQTCHGKSGSDRKGAPSGYDFGTVEGVRAHKDRIFARAAADNTTMPPGPDDPPREERDKLAEWLACGAP
jgi:uncharacterized membrane protein